MKKALLFLCASLCFATPSRAQMDFPIIATPPYNPGLDLLASSIRGQINGDEDLGSAGDSPEPSSAVATYIPSKARTRANLQAFADKTRTIDPAQADRMEALFASTDIMGLMGDVMRTVGLSRNNAADAFAVYWVSAWQAANGRTDIQSAETFKAVAAQAARGLLQSAELARANDAQKQEMAEALMLQAALIDSSMEVAGSDRIQQQAVAKAVLKGAAASGLDLDKMTLTEAGFVKRSPR